MAGLESEDSDSARELKNARIVTDTETPFKSFEPFKPWVQDFTIQGRISIGSAIIAPEKTLFDFFAWLAKKYLKNLQNTS
jgi:hypothetical protein